MQIKQLGSTIDETFGGLQKIVSSMDNNALNTVPFAGSWTAGQILQHIIMSAGGFVEMINGPTKETTGNPREKEALLKSSFLNFDIKMKSPDFVCPPEKNYDKDEVLTALKAVEVGINKALSLNDLSPTCLAFELPGAGFLTRYESLCFIAYHSKRHLHQLENVESRILSTG